jgi:hypothetical protein
MAKKNLPPRAHVEMASGLDKNPREALSDVLAAIKRPGSFAVRRDVSASDLVLEVVGVGPISLPVSQAKARAPGPAVLVPWNASRRSQVSPRSIGAT